MKQLSETVKKAKAILGDRAAAIMATGLHLDKWDSKNLKGCCPVHPEKTPSFIWNKKTKQFKCFGCGATMDILDYYINYEQLAFIDAAKKLLQETDTHYDFPENPKKIYNKENQPFRFPIPEENQERAKVEAYLKTRGISKATLDKRNIKQDKEGNIVFEYRDQNGKLLLVKYRPARKLQDKENKTWAQKDKDTLPILFGMDKIDPTKPLLITEGEIDSLVCIESGFHNAVSVPFGAGNTLWIEHNWDWLEQFEKIILWSDNDQAGEKMRSDVVPRLGEYRCYIVKSKHKDANVHLHKEGKESVLKALEDAEDVPIADVIDLADVEKFDLSTAEKISSGLNGLDKWISGFFLGSLNVITGISSSGKSTLINQICIAEPLQQGYKTFLYSAELQKEQLKSWILFPLAGPDNVKIYDNGPNRPEGYYLDKIVREQINDWLRGKVYIYTNEDDNTAVSLLKKMEQMAKKYGIKNFVIDNLMMIDLECNEYEKLKQEKEFVQDLKKFARRYNAVVHLIAHPRKTDIIRRLTKMDVAGSGNITNLADYVLSIHRVLPAEKEDKTNKTGQVIEEGCPYDNILDLFKNRAFGHQDKTIGLHFDLKSKRMYGDSDDLHKHYGWDQKPRQEILQPSENQPYEVDQHFQW